MLNVEVTKPKRLNTFGRQQTIDCRLCNGRSKYLCVYKHK